MWRYSNFFDIKLLRTMIRLKSLRLASGDFWQPTKCELNRHDFLAGPNVMQRMLFEHPNWLRRLCTLLASHDAVATASRLSHTEHHLIIHLHVGPIQLWIHISAIFELFWGLYSLDSISIWVLGVTFESFRWVCSKDVHMCTLYTHTNAEIESIWIPQALPAEVPRLNP